MDIYIRQNLSDCTLKMGVFVMCKLYFNKIDFTNWKKEWSFRDNTYISHLSKACLCNPIFSLRTTTKVITTLQDAVIWAVATSLTCGSCFSHCGLSGGPQTFQYIPVRKPLHLLFCLENYSPNNIHVGVCSDVRQDAFSARLFKTVPLSFSFSIPLSCSLSLQH